MFNHEYCFPDNVDIEKEEGIRYVRDYDYSSTRSGQSNAEGSSSKHDVTLGGKNIVAVFSAEIGGFNGFTGPACAAELDLPLVDCDTMGRAFPELQVNEDYLN